MSKSVKIAKTALRILIGLFFITTAVLKIISLDNFEIYLYSFNLFNINISAVVARCVITSELLLGSLLIAKIRYKTAWWASMVMLVGFTLFLLYVALYRHDSNCHCMGELVQLNPTWSIVKNIVIMDILLLVRYEEDYHFKMKKLVGVLLTTAAVAVPFACFPTDAVYNFFDKKEKKINEQLFNEFMQDSLAQTLEIDDGDYLLAYLSAGCEYCKISVEKTRTILENNQLDSSHVLFFIWGNEQMTDYFKQTTKTEGYRYVNIPPTLAIKLVFGQFPTYVIVHNGKIKKVTDLRGLNDNELTSILKQ